MPPTTASPKKLPPAPTPSSTPTPIHTKPVVEPAVPPPPAPEAKVVPLTVPEPDGVSSGSVSEPLPDSKENVQSKEQKEPFADENVSEVKQLEQSSSETQDLSLPSEGEAESQSTKTGLDPEAAPAEVETEHHISRIEVSPTESPKEEGNPEKIPDIAEEPGPVLTTEAALQEVPPELEQISDSKVPNEEVVERTEVEQDDQGEKTQTEGQITAEEQVDPKPVIDDAGLSGTSPAPAPPRSPSPPTPQGEIAVLVVENVVSRCDDAQQEPKPDTAIHEESQTTSESKPLVSEGELQEPGLPEPAEEIKDLRDAPEQNKEENKISTEEETVELKIPQMVDEDVSGEIKSNRNSTVSAETVQEKVIDHGQKEAGSENEPSKTSEEQQLCNNAASEPVNEIKADEGKRLEDEAPEEETNDQKGPKEKLNGAESNDTKNILQEEKEKREPELTADEELPKDETQKMIKTETETVSMTDGDKHQNRNTEELAQMVSDVIKAKTSEETLIQGGSETCSQQTNCKAESQNETEMEEGRPERGVREKSLIKDEEGKEGESQIQETVSEPKKCSGSVQHDTPVSGCLEEKMSNEGERTERNLKDGAVAVAVVSVAEPPILLDVANEQENEAQEENTNREDTKGADVQPLGKAIDDKMVAEVTVAFCKEKNEPVLDFVLYLKVLNNTNCSSFVF